MSVALCFDKLPTVNVHPNTRTFLITQNKVLKYFVCLVAASGDIY